MGWNFRRSIRLGPFRFNFSKSGVGTSVGIPGVRLGRDAKGRDYEQISVPGTGMYHRHYSDGSSQKKNLGRVWELILLFMFLGVTAAFLSYWSAALIGLIAWLVLLRRRKQIGSGDTAEQSSARTQQCKADKAISSEATGETEPFCWMPPLEPSDVPTEMWSLLEEQGVTRQELYALSYREQVKLLVSAKLKQSDDLPVRVMKLLKARGITTEELYRTSLEQQMETLLALEIQGLAHWLETHEGITMEQADALPVTQKRVLYDEWQREGQANEPRPKKKNYYVFLQTKGLKPGQAKALSDSARKALKREYDRWRDSR